MLLNQYYLLVETALQYENYDLWGYKVLDIGRDIRHHFDSPQQAIDCLTDGDDIPDTQLSIVMQEAKHLL